VSPLAVQLLRRLALLALLAAAALTLGPPLLRELGLMGGGPQAALDAAARGVEAARAYGGRDDDPPLAAALAELGRAKQLLADGEGRRARKAAEGARARAVEAQRLALARREELRRRAEKVVLGLDRRINDLEDLYGQVTPGLDRVTVSRLLGVMKEARAAAAALFLAYEQGNHSRVVEDEAAALEVLGAARKQLEAARKGR
jgi:hypothetical protein